MSIEIKSFGKLPSGEEAQLYIMENSNGSSVEITNYGGIIRAINVPDRDGNVKNIALGYDSVEGYIPNNGYIGALIGRVGNRIGGARFTLNGVEHKLAKNDGDNHLHGGIEGFDRKLWKAIPIEGICEDSLILKYFSRDGEENYPGNLQVMVTYTFTDDDELVIHYEAIADQDTPVSLTNHCYFNLKGEGCGTIENHVIEINADSFTVVDDQCIPTGEQRPVDGTPFDLREPRVIAEGLSQEESCEQLRYGKGYDHNFNINDEGMRLACAIADPETGRVMTVFTDMPAMQFYAGNTLNGTKPGSCGRPYGKREGLCLETQYAPDSVNHPEFPDSVLPAYEKYDFTTIFAFETDDFLDEENGCSCGEEDCGCHCHHEG